MQLYLHNITGVKLAEIKTMTTDGGDAFYTRRIFIQSEDGDLEIIGFAENGHDLLIDDPVVEEIKKPFELRAA
jgi:hypothetical protein